MSKTSDRAEVLSVAMLAVIPTTEQVYVVRVEIREVPKRKAKR